MYRLDYRSQRFDRFAYVPAASKGLLSLSFLILNVFNVRQSFLHAVLVCISLITVESGLLVICLLVRCFTHFSFSMFILILLFYPNFIRVLSILRMPTLNHLFLNVLFILKNLYNIFII